MAKPNTSTIRDARKPGWFYVENDVIDHYGADVGAIGVAVYVALARFANRDGQAFPAYKTLAANLGLSRNTVITAIRRLEESGLITVEPQTDHAGNPIATNVYTLCAIADQKGQWGRKGGAANEQGGAVYEPPHAADEPRSPTNGRGGANAAYEHDSSNMTHVVGVVGATHENLFSLLRQRGVSRPKATAICATNADPATILASIDNCYDPNNPKTMGGIIERLIDAPPTKGQPYEPLRSSAINGTDPGRNRARPKSGGADSAQAARAARPGDPAYYASRAPARSERKGDAE